MESAWQTSPLSRPIYSWKQRLFGAVVGFVLMTSLAAMGLLYIHNFFS
jgi:ABC-type uncharacterized transport system permease subunit